MGKKIKTGNYDFWAVVTGAASGMGRIYAVRLAEMGYNLLLVDINSERLDETAGEAERKVLSGAGSGHDKFKVLAVVQDLSSMDAAGRIAAVATENSCEVEVLVNNAGMFFFRSVASTSRERLSAIMMVHNYTPLMLCREFLPSMLERKSGYILNISSLAAWMPWPGVGMYANTKRFVKDYSRSIRIECKGSGVSVTSAYFGAVDTPLYKLSPEKRRLAHRLGIMISPEKAVDKALYAMFRKRNGVMPGLFNKIALPFVKIMPEWLLSVLYKWVNAFGGNADVREK